MGIKTHHLPACSTVPQPTAPLHASSFYYTDHIYIIIFGTYNESSQNTKTAVHGALVPIYHTPWHDIPEDS
jgi:hypothetical protein